jgi:hypothetical protein
MEVELISKDIRHRRIINRWHSNATFAEDTGVLQLNKNVRPFASSIAEIEP